MKENGPLHAKSNLCTPCWAILMKLKYDVVYVKLGGLEMLKNVDP